MKKSRITLLAALAVVVIVLGASYAWRKANQPKVNDRSQHIGQQVELAGGIIVDVLDSQYQTTTEKKSGWFKTGQAADLMLSGVDFNDAGGPLLFNHPGAIASDGQRLLLADRNNNRILIWENLPTGNTPPDLVLGQKSLTTNNPGTGLDQLNWPVGVATAEGKVVVADTENSRILIWNSFPTISGQPADIEINDVHADLGAQGDLDSQPTRNIKWPWGVWTDGEKLAITCTEGGRILIWQEFPTRNDQPADIFLTGQGKIGTPRTITSNGDNLIVGDHNAKAGRSPQGNFFWRNWPKQNDQPYDFFRPSPGERGEGWLQGDFTAAGKLVMLGRSLYFWNSFPDVSTEPDLTVGRKAGRVFPGRSGYEFISGDGSDLVVAGGRIYVSLSNGNKIVGYNSIPVESNALPDFVIGSPDIDTNTLETNFIISNPAPVSDGKSLFVSSDFDGKLYVWKNLPDQSNAAPDLIYHLPRAMAPWDNVIYEDRLILAGSQSIYIWNELPVEPRAPDRIVEHLIGRIVLRSIRGVAMDSKYFYLADSQAEKVYVFRGIPEDKDQPVRVLDVEQPGRISSDGQYLAVPSATPQSKVLVFKVDDLERGGEPAVIRNINSEEHLFNLPAAVLVKDEVIFVADTGGNRVLVWNNINDAVSGKGPDVILGEDSLADRQAEIGRDKFFWPAAVAFDGNYLWVGEFKFSERILRFSVQ